MLARIVTFWVTWVKSGVRRTPASRRRSLGWSRSWWVARRLAVACVVRLGLPSLRSDGVAPCAQARACFTTGVYALLDEEATVVAARARNSSHCSGPQLCRY